MGRLRNLARTFTALGTIGLFAPVFACAQSARDVGAEYENIYVFGDSLSDNGNVSAATAGEIPTSPPYAAGRFSNGPMWVDLAFENLTPVFVDPVAPNRSFAAGGARTDNSFDFDNLVPPGVLAQLQVFRFNRISTDTTIGPDDLFTVWAGANNIFDAFGDIRRNPGGFQDQAAIHSYLSATGVAAIADLEEAIGTLIESGARNILVANAPDLGKIPRFNSDPDIASDATFASEQFNQGLSDLLNRMSIDGEGSINIISMDINRLFDLAQARPADFGFQNVSDACINQVSQVDLATLTVCAPDITQQNEYLFWDEIHPTGGGHRIIAMTAIGLLTAPQAIQSPMSFSETGLITARALSRDVSQRLDELRTHSKGSQHVNSAEEVRFHSRNGSVSLFISGSTGSGSRDATGLARGLDYDLQTITAGGDFQLGSNVAAGLAVSYAKSDNDLTDGSHFNITGWQGSLFAAYYKDGFHLNGSLAHGWLGYSDYVRPTTLAPITAKGRTDGDYWAVTGSAGYAYRLSPMILSVDGGLRYIDMNIDGFREAEAPILGLELGSQQAKSLSASVSSQVSVEIVRGSWHIVPYVRAAYEAELDGRRVGSGRLIDNTANSILIDDKLLKDNVVDLNVGLQVTGGATQISVNYLDRLGIRANGRDRQLAARLVSRF